MAGLPRLSQADVLVAARGGGGLLKERMALARSLWEAGVSAEMLPQVGGEVAHGRAPVLVAGLMPLKQQPSTQAGAPVALLATYNASDDRAAFHTGLTTAPASPPAPQAAPSLTDQYEYAQSRGIPWLVIIQASTFGGA